MNNCSSLYVLSTIACQLSECLTKDELELLAANLRVLSEMIEVISVRQTICEKSEQ